MILLLTRLNCANVFEMSTLVSPSFLGGRSPPFFRNDFETKSVKFLRSVSNDVCILLRPSHAQQFSDLIHLAFCVPRKRLPVHREIVKAYLTGLELAPEDQIILVDICPNRCLARLLELFHADPNKVEFWCHPRILSSITCGDTSLLSLL